MWRSCRRLYCTALAVEVTTSVIRWAPGDARLRRLCSLASWPGSYTQCHHTERDADRLNALLEKGSSLLGRRGTGLIITALARGPADVARVRERLPGLSEGVLTRRLRELTTSAW